MFVELEGVLDRSSINAITVAMIFQNDVIWIDISSRYIGSHSTAHCVESDAHVPSTWRCTCERVLVPPLQLIGVERRPVLLLKLPALLLIGVERRLLYNENEKRLEVLWMYTL